MAGEREASLAWVRSIVSRTVLKQSLLAGPLQRRRRVSLGGGVKFGSNSKSKGEYDDVVTCTKGRGVAKMKDQKPLSTTWGSARWWLIVVGIRDVPGPTFFEKGLFGFSFPDRNTQL